MITVADYFGPRMGHPLATEQMQERAALLCGKVNSLLDEAREAGAYNDPIDPDTGTCVSGSRGGSGDGGFRLPDSRTGAATSKHKLARAVDIYDPTDRLDNYISRFDEEGGLRNSLLEKHGLYREAPHATGGWCHLQDLPPGSGRRTFNP